MLGWLFVLLVSLTGVCTLYLLLDSLLLEEKLAYGIVLGMTLHTLAALLLGLILQFSKREVLLSSLLLTGAIAVATVVRFQTVRKRFHEDLFSVRERAMSGQLQWLVAILAVTSPFLIRIFGESWRRYPEGWYAGQHGGVWSDLPIHSGLITSFLARGDVPPLNPYYSGARLTYPFVADFFSAMLARLGWSLHLAIVAPGWILSLVLVVALCSLGTRLTRSSAAGALSVLLVLLSGGAGFILFLLDVDRSGKFWHTLRHLPGRYTNVAGYNIDLSNITQAFLLPQRSFLFGLPLALLVCTLLYRFLEDPRPREAFVGGVVTALLPLVHPHTMLVILFVASILFTESVLRALLSRDSQKLKVLALASALFLIPLSLALPQALWLKGNGTGSGADLVVRIGWDRPHNGDFVWYWLKNLGIMAPLLLAALLSPQVMRPSVRSFYRPFALLFLVATLVKVQPFACCNRKLLVYWYIFSAILVAALIVCYWVTSPVFIRALLAGTILVLVASGGLDLAYASFPKQARQQAFNNDDIELARQVSEQTPPDAVFLAATRRHHAVTDLAGRVVVLGPRLLMAAWGLDYRERDADIARIYSGSPDAPQLLTKYGVSYVVISPSEKAVYRVDEPFFDQRYPLVISVGSYKVFDVTGRR